MARVTDFGILAAAFIFATTPLSFAADQSSGKSMDKGKSSSKQSTDKSKKDSSAVGPHGEAEQGGAGPSGPAPLPPGKAPGFEGAGKEKGRGPTEGGPR